MKKFVVSALTLSLLVHVGGVQAAATLTIVNGSSTTTHALGGLSVSATGNVTVTIGSGSGSGDSGSGSGDSGSGSGDSGSGSGDSGSGSGDSGSGSGGGSGAACVESDSLLCVSTRLPTQVFTKTLYNPKPTQTVAFKFATVASGSQVGSAVATRTSASPMTKMLVISETPGDIDISNKPSGCYVSAVESSTVRYVVNYPTASTYTYCHLQPGKTYYVNAVSASPTSTKPTCSTTTNCGFTFTAK